MTNILYNNIKNISIGHMFFNLNCRYHSYISFKNDINLYPNFCLVKKLVKEFEDLMSIYYKNLFYTKKL